MTFSFSIPEIKSLIAEQFPQWENLSITAIKPGGNDNCSFRLGNHLLIRLPSAEKYAEQVLKEQEWLPKFKSHLSFLTPEPIALGKPSESYPFHWSIYRWIEGDVASHKSITNLNQFAIDLASFLNEFHAIDATNAPTSGQHNFERGGNLAVYDAETQRDLSDLKNDIDVKTATEIWQQAIETKWEKNPVWVHGDLYPDNILVDKNKLKGIIDFGCMAVGDPACDLVMAWVFFDKRSRAAFKSHLNLDEDTWIRARGWALWKTIISNKSPECNSVLTALGLKENH